MSVKPTGQPTGRHPTELPVERIVAMHRDGWSKVAIARYFDVSPATIRDRLERAEQVKP